MRIVFDCACGVRAAPEAAWYHTGEAPWACWQTSALYILYDQLVRASAVVDKPYLDFDHTECATVGSRVTAWFVSVSLTPTQHVLYIVACLEMSPSSVSTPELRYQNPL